MFQRSLRLNSVCRSRLAAVTAQRSLSSSSTNSVNERHLYMWGTNTQGSIWTAPTPTFKYTEPQLVQLQDTPFDTAQIQEIVCGPTDTAILLESGDVYVCGENKNGQLGLGHQQPVSQPTFLAQDVQSICLGSNFSALIDRDGDVWSFGFGGSAFSGLGCLGHGDGRTYLKPKLVESLREDGCFAKQVQVGEYHMTVLTTEGEVLTCGAGAFGRLGNLDTVDQLYLEPVEMLSNVQAISGGNSFTLALQDGILHAWGKNDKGQLGTGLGLSVDIYSMEPIPAPIEADELLGRTVVQVATGRSHAACITQGGELMYWGSSLTFDPVRVTTLLNHKIVNVVCGKDYTIAVTESGRLYSFGKGKTGVLGKDVKNLTQPERVPGFDKAKILSLSAGYKHVACLVEHSNQEEEEEDEPDESSESSQDKKE